MAEICIFSVIHIVNISTHFHTPFRNPFLLLILQNHVGVSVYCVKRVSKSPLFRSVCTTNRYSNCDTGLFHAQYCAQQTVTQTVTPVCSMLNTVHNKPLLKL